MKCMIRDLDEFVHSLDVNQEDADVLFISSHLATHYLKEIIEEMKGTSENKERLLDKLIEFTQYFFYRFKDRTLFIHRLRCGENVDNLKMVGYLAFELDTEHEQAECLALWVNEDMRNRGLGKALIEQFLESGKKLNFSCVSTADQDTIGFWEKHGFEQIGVDPTIGTVMHLPPLPGDDEILRLFTVPQHILDI